MSTEAFKTFNAMAGTPPPAKHFSNWKDADRVIQAKRTLAGLPPSPPLLNMKEWTKELRDLDAQINATRTVPAAAIARVGVAPSLPSRRSNILVQHNAIDDPVEKTRHYRANAAAIDAAHRALKAPEPSPRPLTGFATIDQMNAMQDPIDKMEFYRENQPKIDREYRALNRKKS